MVIIQLVLFHSCRRIRILSQQFKDKCHAVDEATKPDPNFQGKCVLLMKTPDNIIGKMSYNQDVPITLMQVKALGVSHA